MNDLKIIQAEKKYINRVKDLLKESDLPFEDIDEHFEHFLLAKYKDEIIGVVGIEKYLNIALLRSFAVESMHRRKGIGKILFDSLMKNVKGIGIKKIYLLTTTAQKYFAKNGFGIIERKELPKEIQNTKEFKSICPVSAVCMERKLN